MPTSEAQLRAIKKYRAKNKDKIRVLNRKHAKTYYAKPENRLKQNEKMLNIYYLNKKLQVVELIQLTN
jgi:hypothetical protein